MSIYSPKVIATANREGITLLQALRKERMREEIVARRIRPFNPRIITVTYVG